MYAYTICIHTKNMIQIRGRFLQLIVSILFDSEKVVIFHTNLVLCYKLILNRELSSLN